MNSSLAETSIKATDMSENGLVVSVSMVIDALGIMPRYLIAARLTDGIDAARPGSGDGSLSSKTLVLCRLNQTTAFTVFAGAGIDQGNQRQQGVDHAQRNGTCTA
jgi:hypothetical protein